MSNILIVEARFYAHISDMLLDGATSAIEKAGAHFERLAVPGALEIPTATAIMAASYMTAMSRWAASFAAKPTISKSSPANRRADCSISG